MKEKVKNTNEEYYLYGLPVRDAMKNEYYCREINPADVRNAVKEDPTRCIKALPASIFVGQQRESARQQFRLPARASIFDGSTALSEIR